MELCAPTRGAKPKGTSPEITSRSSISLRPSRKSSSMFSICVPAFRRWELHQAVKVCREDTQSSVTPRGGTATLLHPRGLRTVPHLAPRHEFWHAGANICSRELVKVGALS